MAGEITYSLIREHVDDVLIVSDEEIAAGLAFLLERTKQLVEPAGAAGVAALLAGKIPAGGALRALLLPVG